MNVIITYVRVSVCLSVSSDSNVSKSLSRNCRNVLHGFAYIPTFCVGVTASLIPIIFYRQSALTPS